MSGAIPLASINGWWDLVEQRAASTPGTTLFTDVEGRSLTCREYRDQAERVAAGLWVRGVRPGTAVSWQLPTTLEAVVLLAALTRLGVVQNLLMPVLRDAELEPIFARLRPDVFITATVFRGYDHGALGRRLTAGHGQLITCDLDPDRTGLALPQADPEVLADLPVPGAPTDAADAAGADAAGVEPRWVFFTSGTTGTPKGVLHTDRSVIASCEGLIHRLRVNAEDVLSVAYPVTHIGGPGVLAAGLRTGARVVLAAVFDARRTPYDLAAQNVTMLGSAAPFFNAYLAAQREYGPARLFPHLRVSVNGGAAAPAELFERVPRELGGRGLFNGYGATECPATGYAQIDGDCDAHLAARSGLPAPGVSVRAVGPDGRDVPPGTEGELRLRGPQLFAGYLGEPPGSALDEQGYFPSGDLGVVEADGSYRVTGRLKDIIIRNAENISAPQVEALLVEHPAIAEVAVVGLPDPRTGERCCACVVTEPGATLTLTDIIEFCQARRIAPYKIPEQLELVSALPRTPMGKVRKIELRSLVLDGATRAAGAR